MGKRILLIMALTCVALSAKAVCFVSLSNPMLEDSFEFTPLIVVGEGAPEEASVPLGFMLVGYRPEDEEFSIPEN
jgi:hypothetical protein